ncbi:3-keto-disaccharide hydrolase [Mucilaginibacter phyllosphaerae]
MKISPLLNTGRMAGTISAYLILAVTLFGSFTTRAQTVAKDPDVIGRWDITMEKDGKSQPSWLEVQKSGTHTLIGRFTYAFGSARPIAEVKPADGKFTFSIPPQWEPGNRNMDFEFEVSANSLKGTMVYTDGKTYSFTGVRAPALIRAKAPVWGKPIRLFNGKNTKGFHTDGKNQWIVENGILRSLKSGANLISDQKFKDFKLHVEFRYKQGSNSGVYLRGRYEIQIIDTKSGEPEPINNQFSSVYGFLPPNKMMAKNPGEWQSYDITLVGRMITLSANGVEVITRQIIPGLTGGALDANEGEPGPLFIQGDHGPIDYRNIIITPAK